MSSRIIAHIINMWFLALCMWGYEKNKNNLDLCAPVPAFMFESGVWSMSLTGKVVCSALDLTLKCLIDWSIWQLIYRSFNKKVLRLRVGWSFTTFQRWVLNACFINTLPVLNIVNTTDIFPSKMHHPLVSSSCIGIKADLCWHPGLWPVDCSCENN